jgi:integrase
MTLGNIADGMLEVAQGKTGKRLHIRVEGELKAVIDRITGRVRKVRNLALVAAEDGGSMTVYRLWHLFNDARTAAAEAAETDALTDKIRAFQFRDIRAKAASDIEDIKAAKNLLAHSAEELTRRVYVRKPKVVSPVK